MIEAEGAPQLEVTRRFLLRFADLMSNGSNAANLLLAAELLQNYANRACAAEERLGLEQSRSEALESKIVAQSSSDQVYLPKSILRLAKSQFESLSAEFEKSGNLVSQAMCAASASTLGRYLDGSNSPRAIEDGSDLAQSRAHRENPSRGG
jgi:hypothetical protein